MVFFPETKFPIEDDKLSILKFGLQTYGKTGRRKYFWRCSTFLKYIVLVGQTVYAVKAFSEPHKLAEVVATYPVPFMAVLKLITYSYYYEIAQYFIRTVEDDFWSYKTVGQQLQNKINRRFWIMNRILLVHFITPFIFIFLYIFFPFVEIPEGTKRLPALVWVPFNYNPTPIYEIVYALLVWTLILSIFGNAFFDLMFIYAAQHLCVQFILLNELLRNLSTGLMEHHKDIEKLHSAKFQEQVMKRLKACMNHHAVLMKFGQQLKEFSQIILVPQLAMSIITQVIALFILSVDHSDLLKSFMIFNMACSSILEVTIFALQSTEITTESIALAKSAYDSQWHLFQAPIKKCLTLLMMNSQEGIVITAAGMAPINNEVIVFVYQKVMSAVTLLRSFGEESAEN